MSVLPLACLLLLLAPRALAASPVLMISIDGLKPEYVTHAAEHGLTLPTLSRFLRDGSYAEGVVPVLPSVTYPDHTTLLTGVWPSRHGILNNVLFDPEGQFSGAWYWYAGDIRVPTLWDAARQAGIRTASVSWPVSVNAPVDTLIPEYWRSLGAPGQGNPQDRELMDALSRPDGWLAGAERRNGPYMMGNDTSVDGDRTRTRFSLIILERKRPGFMTIHLSSLDESEHVAGPFSREACATLEAIDAMVAQLMQTALRADPRTDVIVVSDHGFVQVEHSVNLAVPLVEAGLIATRREEGGRLRIASWKAAPWNAGGTAAIMLHDPADAGTRRQAGALLAGLAADPRNGIARVLDEKEAQAMGGFPGAAFVVALKPGYMTGHALAGPVVDDRPEEQGAHGYLPTLAEMHASFFALGPGLARGRDLGLIDMRRIAPTVARLLGVALPTADQPPLPLQP